MTKNNIKKIRSELLTWGRSNLMEYPWRNNCTPWVGMLAEILLQRTHVRHVEKYFKEIATLFPNPRAVLNATQDDLSIIQTRFGLGRRIRTIVETANYFDKHASIPQSLEELTDLYGIGHYTAAAYLSLHTGQRAVLVDRNVARWLGRMTGEATPDNIRNCKWLWELADELTPTEDFQVYNYSVLDFTITICSSRTPCCTKCPLTLHCRYPIKTATTPKQLK